MDLSFSIENILARPTFKPRVRIQPYPVLINPHVRQDITHSLIAISTQRKRRKRYRTIFREDQIKVLEELYRSTPYPDLYQRETAAMHAGLQEERVEVWFKNRRARTRKVKKATENSVDAKAKETDTDKDRMETTPKQLDEKNS